ncbi:hypothetical protein VC83_05072 [Pseudogymnoascus destructans]|uniref:RNA polymerase I-specific transcription initiation factor rrn3 n=2 Tax=Pseudogymnoascus destructans TaxID=655981 RepID=L8FVQ0_PSED2|nr:uncharacterized protein VC83_05072 [Pseudogymnoascus destructans]ELR05045.1 hypothetical protein GMDG_01616 [Pseudogymnoascus destructans 20631-21]OAF58486.1 hypothetical protein VC83_05072 [Pseudogymnoascus destructans]
MAPMVRPSPTHFQPSGSSASKPTPTKTLLRKSALAGKRKLDDAGLDLDGDDISASMNPAKRSRMVTFNPLVQEQLFTSSPEAPTDLYDVRRLVRKALDEHNRAGGDDCRYDGLKEVFSTKNRPQGKAETDLMRAHLLALTNCVSLLGKNSSGLVRAVLESEWVGRDEPYVRAYVNFLSNLASAQGAYVGTVLSMLVEKFSTLRISNGRLDDCPIVHRTQLSARVHTALKYLLRLIPSASGTLAPILAAKFPFSDESKKAHMAYINNLIKIIDYAPELKSDIFALITERLVKIDVQMQIDLDDDVAAAVVQSVSNRSDLTGEDDSEADDSDSDSDASDDSLDDEQNRVKAMHENVEKMDAILDTLFELYTPHFEDPLSSSAISTFDTLLSHFRNIILPTYRSRHTQFLLFHFAQTSEHLIDTFAGECVDLAFKSGRPAVLKQSAAAYLASFVSRGANVLPHVVRDVFDYIGTNLDLIRSENELSCRGPDLQRYSTFYATTQALLYIFCFRWRDLVVSPSAEEGEIDEEDFVGRDLEWRAGVKELLDRTIYSKLNPLKICAPSIVEEFAKIAHHLRFMYVYPLLATNKRIRLSQFALGAGNASSGLLRDSGFSTGVATEDGEEESWHQLVAYFPFDPYQLPKSRRWVENDYVAWRGVPGLRQDEEEEEDDSTDSGEDDSGDDDDDVEVDTATDDEEN